MQQHEADSGGPNAADVRALGPLLGYGAGRLARQYMQFWRVYARSLSASIGLATVLLVVVVAALAPLLTPYDPNETNLLGRLQPPAWLGGGSWRHPLGTDQLGRDVLTRTLYGARVSLIVAVPATAISVVLGVGVGVLAAFKGGRTDLVIMRLVDIQRAIPFLLVAIVVMAFLGGGVWALTVFFGVWVLGYYARLVRGDALLVLSQEYVQAALAIGAGPLRLALWHILPNVVTPVIVLASFLLPHMIIAEASLSFLGLGIPRPTPSWGNMMAESRDLMRQAWWMMLTPGAFMVVTILGFNFAGDRLREVWDPHLRGGGGA